MTKITADPTPLLQLVRNVRQCLDGPDHDGSGRYKWDSDYERYEPDDDNVEVESGTTDNPQMSGRTDIPQIHEEICNPYQPGTERERW